MNNNELWNDEDEKWWLDLFNDKKTKKLK